MIGVADPKARVRTVGRALQSRSPGASPSPKKADRIPVTERLVESIAGDCVKGSTEMRGKQPRCEAIATGDRDSAEDASKHRTHVMPHEQHRRHSALNKRSPRSSSRIAAGAATDHVSDAAVQARNAASNPMTMISRLPSSSRSETRSVTTSDPEARERPPTPRSGEVAAVHQAKRGGDRAGEAADHSRSVTCKRSSDRQGACLRSIHCRRPHPRIAASSFLRAGSLARCSSANARPERPSPHGGQGQRRAPASHLRARPEIRARQGALRRSYAKGPPQESAGRSIQ